MKIRRSVARSWRGKEDSFSISEMVTDIIDDTSYDETLEIVEKKAETLELIFGRLIEELVRKSIMSIDDLSYILDTKLEEVE